MTFSGSIAHTPLPKGFLASGVNCGVRRYRPDLGLLFSEAPCVATATFTESTLTGHHIAYCKSLLPSESIQAIVTNSGQANTSTGAVGAQDNAKMVQAVAENLSLDPSQVLSASTGVIGERMAIEKIVNGVGFLSKDLSNTSEKFATAVMTTDLVPKTASVEIELDGGTVRLTGIAKGSGMIHPNMATMLGYLVTDLKVTNTGVANEILKSAVHTSFNMISVDGETSPNDSVFFLANGCSGVELQSDQDKVTFESAMQKLTQELAKAIARDGEGASKLIQVEIKNGKEQSQIREWARSLTVSPLIKTAVHGSDPNWGRIVARLGQEGVPPESLNTLDLFIAETPILLSGEVQPVNHEALTQKLKNHQIVIAIDLKMGTEATTAWGCDLSQKYVQINAEYTT